MFLKKLELNNFRNYKNLSIDFEKRKTLFVGKNAHGKTNILEAINYLSILKSNRIQKDSELVNWESDFCRIQGEVLKNDLDIELDVLINPPSKKIIKLNQIKKTKSADFLGNLVSVNFCVDDLMLLRGAPVDRRSWIDDCIARIYPGYQDRLQKYNKIRSHRNNLLKSLRGQSFSDEVLSVWDEQLVISGSNIVFLRLKYLNEIKETVTQKHSIIAPDEKLDFNYVSTIFGETNDFDAYSIDAIAAFYKEKMKDVRQEEIIRAKTLIGPHRDDIEFFINSKSATKYASQGQQRTIVLSLKLSEIDIIKQKIDDTPLLLLDDVLAELDKNRQNYLLTSIEDDIQTIITSTDAHGFEAEFLNDVKIFHVKQGEVFEVS
ncbi:MAG: DNA replication/repair protein RecF [Candidatus Gastranaerophilales bacterium]|nr:DNA replication/repair protein RecF [Candidatus Gastranaerophilales bacterium]